MKSNKSRSSGSGSFSERYSGGARESKIVDREFRVFLITSFYPLLPLSHCVSVAAAFFASLASCILGDVVLHRATESTRLSSVGIFAYK